MKNFIRLSNVLIALCITSFVFAQSSKSSLDVPRGCYVSSSSQINQTDCDSFQFSATSTSNPSTNILGYYWTFGDGNAASGQNVSHDYSSNGTYSVTLTTIGKNNDGSCCSDTECFEVTVDCTGHTTDCGYLNTFYDVAGNGLCDVVLYVMANDFQLDPGWSVIPNGYEWHLVNQSINVDRYEYGAPPHTTDLTDNDLGPWTITLKITAQDIFGNLCVLETTRTLLSGCGGGLRESSVRIYPNPASDILNINNIDTKRVFQLEIVDQNGMTVKSVNLSGNSDISLPVQELRKGIYFLKFKQNDKVIQTEKFIKN